MTNEMTQIEPGLHSKLPVTRLTHSPNRCTHSYSSESVASTDGQYLTYFQYDNPKVNRDHPETMSGNVTVADYDGSSPRTLMPVTRASANSGAMQVWAGPTHRVAANEYNPYDRRWAVIDFETQERWAGKGAMRNISPDGKSMFLQTGEDLHLRAEEQGKSLGPTEVAAEVIDYITGATEVTISVADVLACHPEADVVAAQHMIFKQTLFSPDNKHLAFVFSNAWYCQFRPEEKRRHEILIADRDGTNIQHLGSFQSHPGWHPSGEYYFALSRTRDGRLVDREEPGTSRFVLYPVDGGDPVILGSDWIGCGHPSIQPVSYRYMASETYNAKEGRVTLHLFDLEQDRIEDILVAEYQDFSNVSGVHFHPAWGPDGKSVYISSENSGVGRVYRVDLVM